MTPERWQRIKETVADALERPVGERGDFVTQVCGDDEALLSSVFSLVRADEESDVAEALNDATQVPSTIGDYQVTGILAHGGTSVVYAATRVVGDDNLQLAIKVLPLGFDLAGFAQRFAIERSVLAQLRHPNIARLIDAGQLPDQRPYLVLERIEGLAITKHVLHHKLSLKKRLELFRKVCGAVQHAHQHLVLHRDLKPGNILVDEYGHAKLLDFGVARILDNDDGSRPTRPGMPAAMTPEYAAPEQLRGEAATTASDVYALGILLFELITGRPAHRVGSAGRASIEHILATEIPPPSHALARRGSERRAVARDLDAVVLQAISQDPSERYSSCAELSEDVRRHLAGEVVVARRRSPLYPLVQLARRNKLAMSLTVSAFIILIVMSTALAVSRANAKQSRHEAEAVRTFLTHLLLSGGGYNRAQNVTVLTMLEQGVVAAEQEFIDQPVLKAEVLETLGSSMHYRGSQGPAFEVMKKVYALRQQNLGADHPATAEAAVRLARLYVHDADYDSGLIWAERALSSLRANSAAPARSMGRALNAAGSIHSLRGRWDKAESLHEEALQLRQQAFPPGDAEIAQSLLNLGLAKDARGRYSEAEQLLERSVTIRRANGFVGPLLNGLYLYSATLRRAGHLERAQTHLLEALTVSQEDSGLTERTSLMVESELAEVYFIVGDVAKARMHLSASRVQGTVTRERPVYVLESARQIAAVERGLGRCDDAQTTLLAALDRGRTTRTLSPGMEATLLAGLGAAERVCKKTESAELHYRAAQRLLAETDGLRPDVALEVGLARIGLVLSGPVFEPKACSEAVGWVSAAQALYPDGHWNLAWAHAIVAACQRRRGDCQQAQETLTISESAMQRWPGRWTEISALELASNSHCP